MLMPWSMAHPEMVLRTCRWRAEGAGTRTSEKEALKQLYTSNTQSNSLTGLLLLGLHTYLHPIGRRISLLLPLSLTPVTHHLLYLGHSTPSKSTTTVAIVTRGRGACCHRISPGPSHPAGTTDCSHCCITELLRLWGGRGGRGVT